MYIVICNNNYTNTNTHQPTTQRLQSKQQAEVDTKE